MVEKDLTISSEYDRICTILPGSFSTFFALFVALTVLLFKKLQTQSFYLVVLQNLSEMIFNLSIIIFYHPPVHGNWRCQFQGWLINYGIMSSIFFSGAIAAHMYLTIKVRGYKLTNIRLIYLTIIIVILSAGIAAIPFSTHQYEDLNAQCWLAEGEYGTSVTNGIIMRFATHYGLIWLTCLFCAYSYIAIVKYVKDIKEQLRTSVLSANRGPSEMEKTIYRLQYYPAILMFVWFGITMCRLYTSLFPSKTLPIWALCTGHAILNTQGLLNGIVFFSYRTVWYSWVKLLHLENYIDNLEPGLPIIRRSFGRKSFNKHNNTKETSNPILINNNNNNNKNHNNNHHHNHHRNQTETHQISSSMSSVDYPSSSLMSPSPIHSQSELESGSLSGLSSVSGSGSVSGTGTGISLPTWNSFYPALSVIHSGSPSISSETTSFRYDSDSGSNFSNDINYNHESNNNNNNNNNNNIEVNTTTSSISPSTTTTTTKQENISSSLETSFSVFQKK